MEDYSESRRQGIEVDDDHDPAPKNTPQINNKTTTAARTTKTVMNWTGSEGIVCPQFLGKLPDTLAGLKNYSQEYFMNISKLDLF